MFAPPISPHKLRERSEHQAQRRAVCRRRWRNNALRSDRSDEDGGNSANIAASGEQSNRARCASSSQLRASGIARRRTEEE
jgi:hypothetical protein